MDIFDLAPAQAFSGIGRLGVERVAVSEALGRIVAEPMVAQVDNPAGAESLRDGYVIRRPGRLQGEEEVFPVVGEIAAGMRPFGVLAPGCACRIFTGGLIPEGGERVVAQEDCQRLGEVVAVGQANLLGGRTHIKDRGSEIERGTSLLDQGVRLRVDHLVALTAAGVEAVAVARRPRVACYCTGSELVAAGQPVASGRKLSVNSLLLRHLLPGFGGVVVEERLVADRRAEVAEIFAEVARGGIDVAVTTGGMGPGKYDLVEQAFIDAGGTVLFDHLPMLPGRSILCGWLGQAVVLALPGPPYAVRTLVHELVGPLLLRLQGASRYRPMTARAILGEPCRLRAGDLLQVKAGVVAVEGSTVRVRPAGSCEAVSCFMLFPPGVVEYPPGAEIEVHPVAGEGVWADSRL